MTAEVLTKEYGLQNNVAPNGRIYGVDLDKRYPGLYKIVYKDGKQGELPEELSADRFTNRPRAQAHITSFLTRFWDFSNNQANKKK